MSAAPVIRFPVSIAVTSWRPKPQNPMAFRYETLADFAIVSSMDEAIGIGVRLGNSRWPDSDGWSVPIVAIKVVTPEQIDAAASSYSDAIAAGAVITSGENGINMKWPSRDS